MNEHPINDPEGCRSIPVRPPPRDPGTIPTAKEHIDAVLAGRDPSVLSLADVEDLMGRHLAAHSERRWAELMRERDDPLAIDATRIAELEREVERLRVLRPWAEPLVPKAILAIEKAFSISELTHSHDVQIVLNAQVRAMVVRLRVALERGDVVSESDPLAEIGRQIVLGHPEMHREGLTFGNCVVVGAVRLDPEVWYRAVAMLKPSQEDVVSVEFTPMQLAILAELLQRCVEWSRLPGGHEIWAMLHDGMTRTAGLDATRAVTDAGAQDYK